jgi:hypothetical protein
VRGDDASDLVNWCIVRVGDDCFQITENLSFGKDGSALAIQHIEVVYNPPENGLAYRVHAI